MVCLELSSQVSIGKLVLIVYAVLESDDKKIFLKEERIFLFSMSFFTIYKYGYLNGLLYYLGLKIFF